MYIYLATVYFIINIWHKKEVSYVYIYNGTPQYRTLTSNEKHRLLTEQGQLWSYGYQEEHTTTKRNASPIPPKMDSLEPEHNNAMKAMNEFYRG